jgi:hypothetical protein
MSANPANLLLVLLLPLLGLLLGHLQGLQVLTDHPEYRQQSVRIGHL